MIAFTVGDKVTHENRGDGEVKYGPYTGQYATCPLYLVVFDGDKHVPVPADDISPRPAFKVGDSVMYDQYPLIIVAGPFTGDDGIRKYVTSFDGELGFNRERDMEFPDGIEPSRTPRVQEDTETINGVTYVMGARYKDRQGDFWEFSRQDDGGVTGKWCYSNGDPGDSGWSLESAVENFSPLTRVED